MKVRHWQQPEATKRRRVHPRTTYRMTRSRLVLQNLPVPNRCQWNQQTNLTMIPVLQCGHSDCPIEIDQPLAQPPLSVVDLASRIGRLPVHREELKIYSYSDIRMATDVRATQQRNTAFQRERHGRNEIACGGLIHICWIQETSYGLNPQQSAYSQEPNLKKNTNTKLDGKLQAFTACIRYCTVRLTTYSTA